MTLKIGDKVALAESPEIQFGEIDDFIVHDGRTGLRIKLAAGGHAIRKLDGTTFSGEYPNLAVVPWFPPVPPTPAYLLVTKTGVPMAMNVLDKKNCTFGAGANMLNLLVGDKLYSYIGTVKEVEVTEEEVPIEPGYKYRPGNWKDYEYEVIAVRDSYAFIQTYRSGVAQGCTTVRISSIPKKTRPCTKKVKQLVKE